MLRFFFIIFAIIVSGCSAVSSIKDMTHEKSSSPPPKQDLFSFGSHYTTRGATEIATESAEEFCYKWRLSPAIKNKQVAERGVLPEAALQEIVNDPNIPSWSPSKAKWETRIIYNCL